MNRKSVGPILLTAAFSLAASFSATPTHAADVVTINYWHTHSAPEEAQLNKLIAMFEQDNPNIKIQETAYAYNDFQKALLTSIAGGQAPDAVRMDIVWVPQFAQQGALLQLDSAMSDFKTISGGTFPGALATNAWNGKYWGLPLDTNTQVLLWNQKVFQAAGITAPPSTVQEFADDACKLTTKVNGTQQYGYAMGGTYFWAVAPLFYSMGAKIVDDKMTTATGYINGKESAAVFQMLVDLYNKGCLSPNLLGGGIGTEQGHGTGAYAMIIDGPWMVDLYKQDFPTFQPVFAPVPAGIGTANSSVVGGEDVVVSASTQHQAETLAWVRFLMSQKAQTFMGQIGIVPTLSALTGSKDLPAYYQVFMTQLQTAQARLPHPKWGAMDDAINAAFTKMLKGDAKVQDALDQAATTINGLLAVK